MPFCGTFLVESGKEDSVAVTAKQGMVGQVLVAEQLEVDIARGHIDVGVIPLGDCFVA